MVNEAPTRARRMDVVAFIGMSFCICGALDSKERSKESNAE